MPQPWVGEWAGGGSRQGRGAGERGYQKGGGNIPPGKLLLYCMMSMHASHEDKEEEEEITS